MATIDQRNGKWRAQVRKQGLGSVSRSFTLKADAQAWARATEAAIERGSFKPAPKAPVADTSQTTLADLVIRYRDTVSVRKKGVIAEHCHLNAFLRYPMAMKKLVDVTASDWASYRDERLKQIKPQSLVRQIAIFKNLYSLAIDEWGFDIDNPIVKVKLDIVDQKRDRRLKEGERELILAEAGRRKNKQLIPVINWAIESAMRTSEILNLQWSDIDLKQRVLTIRDQKNGIKGQQIPITTAMHTILEGQDIDTDTVFPITDGNLKQTWKRILQAVGLSGDLHFHDLRREGISSFFEKGLAIQEVAVISRHSDWKMLKRYMAPKPADILRKLELVTA